MVADNPSLSIQPRKPVVPFGVSPQTHIAMDQTELLSKILQEQQKTNKLLAALVDAIAEDGSDPDAEPARYMDGTPVRG